MGAMSRRRRTADEQPDALAARLMKMLDDESFLLDLAAASSKVTPHARAALRLTLLQIENSLERHTALFDVTDKKLGAEPG
jgi:hypothetical protein